MLKRIEHIPLVKNMLKTFSSHECFEEFLSWRLSKIEWGVLFGYFLALGLGTYIKDSNTEATAVAAQRAKYYSSPQSFIITFSYLVT